VIVSPHIAGMSDVYVDQASTIVEENLRRFVKGKRGKDLLNFIER
jgi:phosphoglycerate dehydrogenase-like enzyme